MNKAQCEKCAVNACTDDISKTPKFCPRRIAKIELEEAKNITKEDSNVIRIYSVAKNVETEGYKIWPRVQELIEFSKQMEYKKLGIAFCIGLKEETKSLCNILKKHDFEVNSVCCTIEGGCNPIGQAMVLNKINTELNIIMGLCIGHDILFTSYSKAPVTTLVVKDRVSCHNPAAPLLNRYWKDSL